MKSVKNIVDYKVKSRLWDIDQFQIKNPVDTLVCGFLLHKIMEQSSNKVWLNVWRGIRGNIK